MIGFLFVLCIALSKAAFEINVNKDDLNDLPFQHAYPRHLRARKVSVPIVIDGKLEDSAWENAMWDSEFVDITDHQNNSLNYVPDDFQSAVALLWDNDYLYVGVRMKEPFIYGNITGHNIQAPYHDNDFEVFVDVSGTTEYYKEFEMNVLNATYDVNWGVPDNAGLSCDDTMDREKPYLPVCVNTTFSGYSGNWTMKVTGEGTDDRDKGLKTATSFSESNFGNYIDDGEWTMEIAFPIERSAHHGGLLDTYGDDRSYDRYHPKYADENIPLYWWIDFARAEHPRKYTRMDQTNNKSILNEKFCPLDCSKDLNLYEASLENPNGEECKHLQERFPTLLGTNPVYGCYFEWVYQALGRNNYMHRPAEWAMVEFSNDDESCRNIEFVGRHAVKLIFLAEVEYKKQIGTYTSELEVLSDVRYCLDAQDCADIRTIMERQDLFSDVQINVIENVEILNQYCTSRPCFHAKVEVSVPVSSSDNEKVHVYSATINENMNIKVHYTESPFDSTNTSRDKICY